MNVRFLFYCFICLLLFSNMVYSDDNRLENTDEFAKKIIRDTFKFGYRFEVGDTLLFAAMSKDSISIN